MHALHPASARADRRRPAVPPPQKARRTTPAGASRSPRNSRQLASVKEPPQQTPIAREDGLERRSPELGNSRDVRRRVRSAREDDAFETPVGALALIAHELRTPLNAALGWASHLRAHHVMNEHVARVVHDIERNLQLEARLVEDLLDFGRIGLGRLRLNPAIVDMREIVTASLTALEPQAAANGIQLRLSDGRPQEACQVRGDDLRLRQVLWNLLSNAVKFTPPGGVVDASLEVDPDWVRVVVRDSGQGMNPRFAKVAFHAFAQEQPRDPTTNRQGLGLGLAIVGRLVELHNGFVTVDSGESRGATFTVGLPRHVDGEVG
jgi:signal transduction histidine kinase